MSVQFIPWFLACITATTFQNVISTPMDNETSMAAFQKLLDAEDNGMVEHKEIRSKRFEPFSNGDRYYGEKRFDPLVKRFEPSHEFLTEKRFELMDKRFDPYSKRFDPYSKRFDPMDKRFDPYSKRFDPYSKRFDPYSKRFDPYSKRFDPYSKRFDPYTKRFNPFSKRFNPYFKRKDDFNRYWIHFDQNKRNIIDPQAFQIGLGRR